MKRAERDLVQKVAETATRFAAAANYAEEYMGRVLLGNAISDLVAYSTSQAYLARENKRKRVTA